MSVISKHNYLDNNIVFYMKPIYEYDMKQGGFSILKEKKILNKGEIDYINKLSKENRVVYIGKILRDKPYLNKVLNEGFAEARQLLYDTNELEDSNIISIKKDAIFINKKITNLKFGEYEFSLKNKFTFLAVLDKIEFYLDEKNELVIKGLGDRTNECFLNDLKKIFILIKKNNLDLAIKYLRKYRRRYLEKELDIETYRELNLDNSFRTNIKLGGNVLLMEECNNIDNIDISYNYMHYLLPIIKELL